MQSTIENDPVQFIAHLYQEKRKKNSSYSLRAFSKFLDISPARLSQILSGARAITKGQIAKIAIANSLTPGQCASLLNSVKSKSSKSNSDLKTPYIQLEEDIYKVLSEVDVSVVCAALPLTQEVKVNQIKFLSKKLGLSSVEVRSALSNLIRVGLVNEINGTLQTTEKNLASSSGTKSSALRKFHKEILERATLAIENQSIEERDFSSMTLCIDPKYMNEAKSRIKEFRREMSQFLETSGTPSDVYALNIQFFKLSK
jgi:uncharacterized protein (TIGR02147 family)